MKLMIQDPSYVNGMRLGEALIDACKKSNDGAGAFAFVEENGIDLFLGDSDFIKFIKTHSFELVVGTDSITDPKAITKLRMYDSLYQNLTIYCYVHDPRRFLFHPKITWFETSTGGLSIIGSGNLTERGLYHNVEMFAYDNLNFTDLNRLKNDWKEWLDFSIENNLIFDIDDPIVDHAANLSATKKPVSIPKANIKTGTSPISASLLALYKKQPKTISTGQPKKTKKVAIRKRPKRAAIVIAKQIPTVVPIQAVQTKSPAWAVNNTDRVLIAEVPKASSRWKQINFDKKSFQNYFGATAGGAGGTYRILLKNVDSGGTLGETESRPSVSVASHNWRFEIGAANGLDYPTGNLRPYVIFSEALTRSFIYELVMPGDPRYVEVNNYVDKWKLSNGVNGIARIITDVNSIKKATPNLGLWKI